VCKTCTKKTVLKWQKENKDKVNLRNREYKTRTKIWLSEKSKAYTRCRFGSLRKQTPKWANKFYINEIYSHAKLKSKLLNIDFHVDHIIPLQGVNVCGLHIESNLQIIPKQDNLSKGNKY
jgi:hypothetical protein